MEKLKKRFGKLSDAIASVSEAIEFYKKYVDDKELSNSFRDSLIQRFEYSIDMLWKYLRHYLQEIKRMEVKPSPTDTLEASLKVDLISSEEFEILMEAIKERNKTSHIYREEIADFLAKQIPKYFRVMSDVIKKGALTS